MVTEPIPGIGSFHDQFLLAAERLEPPRDWQVAAGAGWNLIAHPSLPVTRLRTADGVEAGFALGHLIDGEGRFARDAIALPFAAPVAAGEVERFLYRFGGRFACIVLLPGLERVYLDPLGTLATVWCGRRRRVASTVSLLLYDEPDHPVFQRRPKRFPGDRADQFFPGELTAAPEVRRVLPNHFLDLAIWHATRHHPSEPYEEATEDEIAGLVATFHGVVRRQIGAMLRECSGGYLALTAGYDSRRLLACARDFVDQLECVTLERPSRRRERGDQIDLYIAERLAARAGVRHRVIPMSGWVREEAEDYVRRIGYAGGPGKSQKFLGPPLRHLDLRRAWMTGHGGGRCNGRHVVGSLGDGKSSADGLLELLDLPARPGFPEAVDRWLAGTPRSSRGLHLELAFLELQVGGWASPHLYGTAPFRLNLLPLTHRQAIDAVLRVPAAYRASGRFNRDLLRLAWPELLDLPFNHYNLLDQWVGGSRSMLSRTARRFGWRGRSGSRRVARTGGR